LTVGYVNPDGTDAILAGSQSLEYADGKGTNAAFGAPVALTVDPNGVIYVADQSASTIRRVTRDGVVTTFAGAANSRGTNDGPALSARFARPSGVAAWSTNGLFVADQGNHTLRFIGADGTVSTVGGVPGIAGVADGPRGVGLLNDVSALAVDAGGVVYFTEPLSRLLRKLDRDGTISTLAGQPYVLGADDGIGSSATFIGPTGIALGSNGALYIADHVAFIREYGTNGSVRTLGPANPNVLLPALPYALSFDAQGRLYIGDSGAIERGHFTYLPVVLSNPADVAAPAGATVSFSATIAGPDPKTYQWYRDGTPVDGGTGDTLNLTDVQQRDAGGYTLVGSNSYGSVTSSPPAVLKVAPALPIVEMSPTTETILVAGQAFGVMVTAIGTEPFAYQWLLNGVPIQGATNAAYSVTAADAQAGAYNCLVSNAVGSATNGANIVLWVRDLPPTITAQTAWRTSTPGGTVSFSAAATGSTPISWQWMLNGTPIVGETNTMLTLTNLSPQTSVVVAVASNAFGSAQTLPASLLVGDLLFVQQPYSIQPALGYPVSLTTVAFGSDPVSYQWFKDGAPLPGATNDSFTIASFERWNAGSYTVAIANLSGTITSAPPAVLRPTAPLKVSTAFKVQQPSALAFGSEGLLYSDGLRVFRSASDGSGFVVQGSFFGGPAAMATGENGRVYVTDFATDTLSVLDGTNSPVLVAGRFGWNGTNDGPGLQARFNVPNGVGADASGNLYVADTGNSSIRKVTPDGTVSTYAGVPGFPGAVDGPFGIGRLTDPGAVAVSAQGDVWVYDATPGQIRIVHADRSITTLMAPPAFPGAPAAPAAVEFLYSMAFDASGRLFAINPRNEILLISPDGTSVPVAGFGPLWSRGEPLDGVGVSARFGGPDGMAFGPDGALYIADTIGNGVRRAVPIPVDAPVLDGSGSDGAINLTWAGEPAGFQLQSAPSFNSGPWKPLTNGIANTNGILSTTVGTANSAGYFRLVDVGP
jgi:sugar lactone lactonase YvrE